MEESLAQDSKGRYGGLWALGASLCFHVLLILLLTTSSSINLTIGRKTRLDLFWLTPSSAPTKSPVATAGSESGPHPFRDIPLQTLVSLSSPHPLPVGLGDTAPPAAALAAGLPPVELMFLETGAREEAAKVAHGAAGKSSRSRAPKTAPAPPTRLPAQPTTAVVATEEEPQAAAKGAHSGGPMKKAPAAPARLPAASPSTAMARPGDGPLTAGKVSHSSTSTRTAPAVPAKLPAQPEAAAAASKEGDEPLAAKKEARNSHFPAIVDPDARPRTDGGSKPPPPRKPAAKPSEERGLVIASLQGDLKLVITGDSNIKLSVTFKPYPKARRSRPLTRAESRREQQILPVFGKREQSREAVIETAREGVYTFRAEAESGGPARASFTLKIFETGGGGRVARLGTRSITGRSVLAKVLMPDGILWDDDSAFTGSLEDAVSTTKFNAETGIYWKEYND